MSRRTLSTIGSVVAVLVVLAAVAWTRGTDDGGTSGSAGPPSYAGTSTADGQASGQTDPDSGLRWIDEQDLPVEARTTLDLIDAGGPFPYPGKDGSTFGNFERLLPQQQRGYYEEYTVPTPGSRDRGARRIITGDGGEYYWTADHYEHFDRIRR
ncbi:ribonuclease domain-containing protein [Nocardioides terrae]|uniref:ribonuclease domain-containing protein n=1 Tax=Nocardioides terrae TaxID=574651 RepID=UPI001FE215B2|nr:ribonuclease domain-containing protein [Nocardioides terrae]